MVWSLVGAVLVHCAGQPWSMLWSWVTLIIYSSIHQFINWITFEIYMNHPDMLHFFLFSDTIREILAFPKAIRWCFTPGLCTYLSHLSFRRVALNCLSCFHSIQPLDLDFWVAHCYRDKDLKVENESVDAFSSSIVNVALSSVHPSLKYLFFVLYSTTLVHCWLEFMKAVMSLCRVNSNCVTRSYFFFPFSNLFYFPLIY